MVARVEGARKATGDVLTFLDSHIDPQTDWLEPLLYRVQQDRRHVVMPIIDGLTNDGSYSYKRGGIELVGFNAHLVDHGINLQKKDDFPGRTAVDPQPSPAMAGGLFSVDREYFFHIGAFDEGMGHWGGENIEIGFRVWQCGGTIELIPCSRVGHVFGGMGGGCPWPGAAPGTKNKWRAIRAWMDDEHAAVMQKYLPEPNNVGDISNMHELRDRLQCRSFQWFLDNVYPECWMNTVNHPVCTRAFRSAPFRGGSRRHAAGLAACPCPCPCSCSPQHSPYASVLGPRRCAHEPGHEQVLQPSSHQNGDLCPHPVVQPPRPVSPHVQQRGADPERHRHVH